MIYALTRFNIQVPDGFAITAHAYRQFLDENKILEPLKDTLKQLDTHTLKNLAEVGKKCRTIIESAKIPNKIQKQVFDAYHQLNAASVAVRSSATAEDLPTASFAGQHENFRNPSLWSPQLFTRKKSLSV